MTEHRSGGKETGETVHVDVGTIRYVSAWLVLYARRPPFPSPMSFIKLRLDVLFTSIINLSQSPINHYQIYINQTPGGNIIQEKL